VAGFRERGAGAGLADGDGFGDAAAGGGGEGPGAMEYLTSVLSSKVYDVAIESPLQLATKLSERLGVNLWIKREDLQPVIDGDAQPSIYLPPATFFGLVLCSWTRLSTPFYCKRNIMLSSKCQSIEIIAAPCVCGYILRPSVTKLTVIF
jgi:hypothetical protein